MKSSDANVSATADLSSSDTLSIQDEPGKPEGFYQGATWSLDRLAAWLETTKFVVNDEVSQLTVDNTKKLIAEQAKHAADKLRDR